MSASSKLVKPSNSVSRDSVADLAAKKVSKQPAPRPVTTPKANTKASGYMADTIEQVANLRADQEAEAIAQFAQGVYDRRLAQNLERIFGGDLEAYFPSPLEGRTLPEPATAPYLPTIEVEALPSAD